MTENNESIKAVCQECHQVIKAPTNRAAGLLLAFHIFDQHYEIFIETLDDLVKTQGDSVLGKEGIKHSLIKSCDCGSTNNWHIEQSKSGYAYKAVCEYCNEEIKLP